MTEIDRIEDQLRKSVEGGAWHGPSLNELLNDVTPAEAAAAPVKGAHSIWEITLHVIITLQLVLERLEGKPASYSGQQDWPPVGDTTSAAWSSAIRSLNDTSARLRHAVLQERAVQLDEPIVEGFSSVYATLHGTVQHNLYHAGQIALLKKTIRFA
jgi:uncharacterized damage-inducible protein DinB